VDETDVQLVNRSLGGDTTAFGILFQRYGSAVHSYLARRVGRQEADDLLSEVWLRAFRGRAGMRGPSSLPWLYGIAHNVVRAHWRQDNRPALPLHLHDASDPWPDADDRLAARAQQESIRRALAMLSDNDRDVLLLVVWEQLTPSEAAMVLDLPQGTARSRLHRALSTLRQEGSGKSPILIGSHLREEENGHA
jgi:RNA polymerase sigma factor (sigma-70 family)